MEELLKKLISFKTVSENIEENEKALKWVKSKVSDFKVEERHHKNHPVLIVGEEDPEISLQAHMDVVPAKESHFKPVVKKGKLFGRGAYDMKFAIACYLKVLEDLSDKKSKKVGMMITSDEELGGFNGVKAVLDDGYNPDFCFLPDGGDNWSFDRKVKGVWHLDISATGTPGHASRPWEGDSALHKLLSFLRDIEGEFPDHTYNKECFESTLNIGKIEGGVATNQIAEKAKAKIDIRFPDEKEKTKIENLLNEVKNKYEGITVKEDVFGSAFSCDLNHRHCKKFAEKAESYGKKVSKKLSHGSSDIRFFAQKGIPAMMIKPKGGGSHSSKEWIDLEDLKEYCEVLKDFIKTADFDK